MTGFQYESWHFRYVGYPSAYYITQNGLVLEEYIDQLHEHPVNDPLLVSTERGDYALYYVPAAYDYVTDLPVPDQQAYTLSGDNDGGFIVTVDLSHSTEDSSTEENTTDEEETVEETATPTEEN